MNWLTWCLGTYCSKAFSWWSHYNNFILLILYINLLNEQTLYVSPRMALIIVITSSFLPNFLFFLPLTYKFVISIFSYTRVLVHYPYMVFLVVFVVITTCLVLSLTLVEFPKFGNPLDVSMITLILIFKLHIFLLSFINGITMSSINN